MEARLPVAKGFWVRETGVGWDVFEDIGGVGDSEGVG